ncbi:MAG: hypothetical protein EOP84_23575 [Verrucomicrobiaceae bacterium]|nr:MAG: hypothetical protein EOP84_23575 [Verrucomicrobiaceae bacterium]
MATAKWLRSVTLALLPMGIPLAALWVWHRERLSYRYGRPLTENEKADAHTVGVKDPERVRVWLVERIEVFRSPFLNHLTAGLQQTFSTTIGITLRYGILIRHEWDGDRRLLVHELAHVAQYERLGGILPFLLQYLRECIRDGYHSSQLEQDAVSATRRICKLP